MSEAEAAPCPPPPPVDAAPAAAAAAVEMTEQASPPPATGGDAAAASAAATPSDGATVDAPQPSGEKAGGKLADDEPTSSMPVSATSMICNVVGGGVLSLSTAASDASPVVFVFLLFFITYLTYSTAGFVIEVAFAQKQFKYLELVQKAFGKFYRVALLCLMLFPFGAVVAYVKISSEAMPPVFEQFLGFPPTSIWCRESTWCVVAGCVFFLLSAKRYLSEMFLSSLMGIATIMFAIFCMCVRMIEQSYVAGGELAPKTYVRHEVNYRPFYITSGVWMSITVTTFSLSIHGNICAYCAELENRTYDRFMKTLQIVFGVVTSTYLIIALCGYYTFGYVRLHQCGGNVIHAYSPHDTLMNVARLGLFLHFCSVAPLLHAACRRFFNNCFFGDEDDLPMHTIVIETACNIFLASVIAHSVPGIDVILSLTGAIAGSGIVFVIPSVLYIRLVPTRGFTDKKKAATAVLIFGLCIAVLGVYTTFY